MKKISILGLGYIGLPTACILANNNYEVIGVDVDENIINKLNSGRVHINEPELDKIFLEAYGNKRLRITKTVEESDIFVIAVPTPLKSKNIADLKYVINASNMVKDVIKKDDLVVLESTSPPFTTENTVGKIISSSTGMVAGDDFCLAFCPERVLPGNLIYEIINNDRVIGGINKRSAEKAKELYSSFTKGEIYITDLETAELVKLVENTYRDINLAFSNELSILCKDFSVNVWDVIRIANRHPRVNILEPGPGVGGHCIPIDPWFLLQNSKTGNTLIKKSREINDKMPFIVINSILEIIKNISNPKVTLFGASYKKNVGDTRESPTVKIFNGLNNNNIKVSVYDPLVTSFKYNISTLNDSLIDSDLLVVLVGHEIFKEINLATLAKLMRNKNLFDTRNFFNKQKIENEGFNCYSL